MFWIVLETIQNDDSVRSCSTAIFNDELPAIADFHAKASLAASGSNPYHAVELITSKGNIQKYEIVDRREN